MTRLLPMLPIIAEGIIILICGVYQILIGRESFLMSGYKKKYNYEKCKHKFIKACGIFNIIESAFIAILLPFLYLYGDVVTILLISIPLLCCIRIGYFIIIKLYTDNLEKRKYKKE